PFSSHLPQESAGSKAVTDGEIPGQRKQFLCETVELTQTTELHDSGSVTATGSCSIPWTLLVKGQCQGEVHKVTEKMLTLSQGTVLAYKRKRLFLRRMAGVSRG
uniref:Gasdermin pore forming domain-containing protein n=1 Tax=Mustela putorius furo TaxID=9669 RepID=M3XQG8_MUSPF